MTLKAKKLMRVFLYNGAELADMGSHLSPQQVAELYSPAYPELLNSSIQGPEVKGEKLVYTFFKAAGGKG